MTIGNPDLHQQWSKVKCTLCSIVVVDGATLAVPFADDVIGEVIFVVALRSRTPHIQRPKASKWGNSTIWFCATDGDKIWWKASIWRDRRFGGRQVYTFNKAPMCASDWEINTLEFIVDKSVDDYFHPNIRIHAQTMIKRYLKCK